MIPPLLAFLAACAGPPHDLSFEELLDPTTCATCHPSHVAQWAGSMHAYAADDPIFRAMNARAQREAGVGGFCVGCHAPIAVLLGETDDGLDLDAVPGHLRGVTCAWCHLADAVTGDHNAALEVTTDGVMRGAIALPAEAPHASAASPLHDGDDPESSALCGACHDVVTPAGVHVERTYLEWRSSVFAGTGLTPIACGGCHMPPTGVPASGGSANPTHDHAMVGVDVPLVPFPLADSSARAVEDELDRALLGQLCVLPLTGGAEIAVTLEAVDVGHGFPSGASHARRMWAEVVAYVGDEVVWATGVVDDGEPLGDDPYLWRIHDTLVDGNGDPALMMWDAAGVTPGALPVLAGDPGDPTSLHQLARSYPVMGYEPDRVELRVRLRPVGLDILGALVESGDLPAAIPAAMPTFDLGTTELTWEGDLGSCVR